MAVKVNYTEKELIDIINSTVQDEEYKKFLFNQIKTGKIIPVRRD